MSVSTSDLPGASPAARPVSTEVPAVPAWKNEVAARIRDHRARRTRTREDQPVLPGMESMAEPEGRGAASVATRVAQRYARVPSYREAMEAEAAARARASEAEVAATAMVMAEGEPVFEEEARRAPQAVPVEESSAGEAEPWQPDLLRYSVSSDSLPPPRFAPVQAHAQAAAVLHGASDCVVDPFEEAVVEPASPLPARLLEFPHELIAPRKARPRLVEGPLRDAFGNSGSGSRGDEALPGSRLEAFAGARSGAAGAAPVQELRILEAEPEPLSSRAEVTAAGPEWHSIHLDSEQTMPFPLAMGGLPDRTVTLHVASLEDRAMAAVVDLTLVLAAFLLFVLVFAACSTALPSGHIALAGAGATLIAMGVLYQVLFFALTEATPGMRYAKIALCTFDDENPTREALRSRIAALLLSALPLGCGFFWAIFDQDSLGWHDRMTQTYQRSYRD